VTFEASAAVVGAGWATTSHTDATIPTADLYTDDFVGLFRLHYPRLVKALVMAGATPESAEDMAQEAFSRTLRHWRRVRQGTSAGGYVYRVGFRLLARRVGLNDEPLDGSEPDPSNGIEDAAVANFDVARALHAMPPRRRACVVMCWCLDWPTSEAADALGIAPGTVRKQLDLARSSLRTDLAGRD